jgi:hypothetical protein
MQEIQQQERRRSSCVRIASLSKCALPTHVMPTSRGPPKPETSLATASSSSLKAKVFYEGMRLFVTLPLHSPSDPLDQEYIGQVTRIEDLPDGNRGIAVQLLSAAGIKPVITVLGTKQNY